MTKKIFIIISFTICFFISASYHNSLNGWYTVKIENKTPGCNYDNVWAYYENGVEKERRCYLLLAHRGWGEAPENSLESFKLVKENGYDGFETDVRFTKDDIAVLSHDETINRIARNKDLTKIKNKVYVNDLTFDELNEYVFPTTRNNKVLKEYSNNKITTLEEALKYAKENSLYIAVELKEGSYERIKIVIDLVHKYQMEGSVKYISFYPKLLKRARDIDPYATLHLLDKSIHTSKGTCTPDFETKYCKSITKRGNDEGLEQRKYFHKLLDTKDNFVFIAGEVMEETNKSISIVSNYPEDITKYPAINGNELILADEDNYKMIIDKLKFEIKDK